jgi:hypothetical protein
VAVDAERHEVATAQCDAGRRDLLLRDVADAAIAATHRPAGQLDGAGVEQLLAEDGAQQARLARPVRAEHRDELAGRDAEVEPGPQRALAERESRAVD